VQHRVRVAQDQHADELGAGNRVAHHVDNSRAAAVEREVMETDEFPGRIEAIASVEVRARINGYIQSVNFKPGAEVRKGDLLFVIDPRPLEAEVSRAEATLANTRAQLDLSRTELTRFEQLLAEQATSKREYDDAALRETLRARCG